jgi:hypothetical protein
MLHEKTAKGSEISNIMLQTPEKRQVPNIKLLATAGSSTPEIIEVGSPQFLEL